MLLLVILHIHSNICAQLNSHYWGNQYGAKGFLLNGAVIASIDDEAAIFYNPAAIIPDSSLGVSFSVTTPNYSILRTNNFLGEGTSVDSRRPGLTPGMVAAVFKPFKTEKLSVGFTGFQRYRANIRLRDRVVNVVPEVENQLFIGGVEFDRQLIETWVGMAFAAQIHKNLKLGVTQFFSFRSENMRVKLRKEIINTINPEELIASWRSDYGYGISANGSMITKLGLKYYAGQVRLGASFTTANYGMIHKSGNYSFDDQKLFTDGSSSLQSNLRNVNNVEYKSPWSVAIGTEFPLDKLRISFSMEYFHSIAEHNIINDSNDPLRGLSPNSEEILFSLSQRSERVINLAFGIQRPVKENLTLFHGMRTDFSPNRILNLVEGLDFLSTTPDFVHISSGLAYRYKSKQIGFGLDYGFGLKRGGQQLTDISNITTENIFLFSGNEEVDVFAHQITLFLTYNF
jgi:hypothetical protein